MNQELYVLKANLHIFGDGAAAGDGGDGGDAGAAQSGDLSNVVYGKQDIPGDDAGDAGQKEEGVSDAEKAQEGYELTPEDRKEIYKNLIRGEYKQEFEEDVQNIINKRFAKTKTQEAQLQGQSEIIDTLMQRYKIQDGDLKKLQAAIENDAAWLAEAADEAGLTVEQYKQFQKLERDNRALLSMQQSQRMQQQVDQQVQRWVQESEAVKKKFPTFELNTEMQNPQFVSMLKSNIPVEHAYKLIHYDEILQEAMQTTASKQEKQVIDNVRARGMRPSENGVSDRASFTVKDDVSKLTKKDRAEIARRAARGERISF